MTGETKPGDPADRAADGAFGGVHSHRAGYGDDRLARLVAWLRAHPTTTLASGEGALLLGEIDRLRARCRQIDDEAYDYAEQIEQLKAAAKDSADHYTDARAEIDRLRDDRDNLSSQLRDCTYNHDGWKQRAERFERKIAGLQEESTLVVAERDRLERILAALREPSDELLSETCEFWPQTGLVRKGELVYLLIRAAVAAAEQEVGRE